MPDTCIVIGRTDTLNVTYISVNGLTLRKLIEKVRLQLNIYNDLPQTPNQPEMDIQLICQQLQPM
jgi:hypothetical protein